MKNRDIQFIVSLQDKFSATWKRVTGNIGGSIKGVVNQLTTVKGAIQAAFAGAVFKNALDSFKTQEQASARLAVALRNIGVTSKSTQQGMEAFSASMQKVTTFGDETVTNVQAMLVAMTGTNAGVQDLTKATLDMAAGFHMDAEAAAQLVGKTLAGQDALGRYGISVKGATTQQEKMNAIIQQAREKFGGFAEGEANTATGSIEQMKNAWGDMMEVLGQTVAIVVKELKPAFDFVLPILQTAIPVAVNVVKLAFLGLYSAFIGLAAGIEKLGNMLGLWDSKYFSQMLAGAEKLAKEYGTNIVNAFDSAGGAAKDYAIEIGHANTAQGQLTEHAKALQAEIDKYTKMMKNAEPGSVMWRQMGALIADAKDELDRFNAAFTRDTRTGFQVFSDKINETAASITHLQGIIGDSNQWSIIDPNTVDQDAQRVRDQAELFKTIRLESFTDGEQRQLAELEYWYGEQQVLAHGNQELLTNLETVYDKKRADIRESSFKKSMQTFAQLAQQAIGLWQQSMTNQHNARLAQIDEAEQAELAAIDNELARTDLSEKQREELRDKRKAAEQQFADQRRAENIRDFKAQKSAAIIQSIMQTAVAVVEALPNVFLAAAVGALGAAQTAIIASQPVPAFHTGGTAFIDAPPNQETMLRVRGQETVRVTTPEQERAQRSGGTTLIVNFNSPMPDHRAVVQSIKKALRETGMTVDRLLVDDSRRTLVTA